MLKIPYLKKQTYFKHSLNIDIRLYELYYTKDVNAKG